jgi:hypothetical protein
MKKSIVMLLVLGLIFGSLVGAADAKKKKKKPPVPVKVERKLDFPYQCPCGPSAGGQDVGFWLLGLVGGGPTPTGADDNYVAVSVEDGSGGAVYVKLAQDVDGDLQAETDVGSACGTTDTPLAIPNPGVDISIFVYDGFCQDGSTPSQATSGTIHLTFSNIP